MPGLNDRSLPTRWTHALKSLPVLLEYERLAVPVMRFSFVIGALDLVRPTQTTLAGWSDQAPQRVVNILLSRREGSDSDIEWVNAGTRLGLLRAGNGRTTDVTWTRLGQRLARRLSRDWATSSMVRESLVLVPRLLDRSAEAFAGSGYEALTPRDHDLLLESSRYLERFGLPGPQESSTDDGNRDSHTRSGSGSATRVLDIGCGHADFLLEMCRNRHWIDAIGVEVDDTTARVAQERTAKVPNITVLAGGFVDLHPVEEFDVIYARNMIYYLSDAESQQLFSIAARGLRPGGRLVVSFPSRETASGAVLSVCLRTVGVRGRNKTLSEVQDQAAKAGLTLTTSRTHVLGGGYSVLTFTGRSTHKEKKGSHGTAYADVH